MGRSNGETESFGSIHDKGTTPSRCGCVDVRYVPVHERNNPCLHCYLVRCFIIICTISSLFGEGTTNGKIPSVPRSYHSCWWKYVFYINLIHFSVRLAGPHHRDEPILALILFLLNPLTVSNPTSKNSSSHSSPTTNTIIKHQHPTSIPLIPPTHHRPHAMSTFYPISHSSRILP